jgi:hypothetical protein
MSWPGSFFWAQRRRADRPCHVPLMASALAIAWLRAPRDSAVRRPEGTTSRSAARDSAPRRIEQSGGGSPTTARHGWYETRHWHRSLDANRTGPAPAAVLTPSLPLHADASDPRAPAVSDVILRVGSGKARGSAPRMRPPEPREGLFGLHGATPVDRHWGWCRPETARVPHAHPGSRDGDAPSHGRDA